MRIGITGASGMLGSALLDYLSNSYKVFATSRSKSIENKNIQWNCFDLTNTASLNNWLKNTKPDLVIHCAALVNVDLCEENIGLASALHVETTQVIANYLEDHNARLIYISTDSVFDGKKQGAYIESDSVDPLNVYAKTKLMGEIIAQSVSKGLVLRTNIIGWTKKGKISFAEWVLKRLVDHDPVNLFYDVYFSPLHVENISSIIERIIKNPIFGIYHCASSDCISKYDFGMQLAKVFNLSNSNIKRVSVDNMNFKAERPKNMTLDVDKISSALKCDFPCVLDAIALMKMQYDTNIKLLN
jgi:dTDP-4-dehydrorhamnose reductase